ncbi:MAG: hypothetical protein JST47_00925 [Bacteroidetes bacterium]|nr:hypothetical protein [Bacteroidota bacterium]MBS1973093.1 hypothetical protein [Bacteroidota bacterium]
MRLTILFFLLSLLLPAVAQSQYIFQHVTAEDGLIPGPKISTMQDAEGYYWFASSRLLQRFDGKNFITYKYHFKNKPGYDADWSVKPIEDKEGNIWARSPEGINIFKRKERRLERLYMSDAPDSNTSNICNVFKDVHDNIWIISSRNIFRYDHSSAKPVFVATMNENFSHAVYDRGRNRFWILLDEMPHEMVYFDCKSEKFGKVPELSLISLFSKDNPVSLFKIDADNNLWVSNYIGDLCMYDPASGKVIYYNVLHNRHNGKTNLPNSAVFDLSDNGNSIWFTSDFHSGLIRFDKKTKSFSFLRNDNGSEYGLHYESESYDIYQDRDRNIWVNTDMGMNIFNPQLNRFKYFDARQAKAVPPFSSDVTSFFESSKNEIWVGTWGAGVFRYDSNFNLLAHYTYREKDKASFGEPFNKAWSFGEDRSGKIWIGCQYAMLSVLNTGTGKFKNEYVPDFQKQTIMQMTNDQKGNFWFGLHSGFLGEWNADSNKFCVYKNLYGPGEKNIHAIDGLCVDKNNKVWVATGDDKLRCFDPDKKIFTTTALSGVHVLLFSIVNDSLIIGGTLGSGAFVYNINNRQKRFFTTEDGLTSNTVYGAVAQNEHNIWVLTNESIERIDMVSGNIRKFGSGDGIKDHVFGRAICQLKNGTMLIASNSGVIYFRPDGLIPRKAPPNVTITALRIDQNDVSVDSLAQLKETDLAHSQNSIAIEFGSLSFSERKDIEYFYKLDGSDKKWIAAGNQQSVMYASLAPGKYTFQVRSQNRDGLRSPGITSLIIVISPAWWQTWWAYLLWACMAISIVYSVYNYRKANKTALSRVRQKIASDLHDDIGSTLNSISVYSEVAGRQLNENSQNAKALIEKIGAVSRNMIENMNDIVWAINPRNDQFGHIIQKMQYFAGELLSGKNILLQFSIDEKIKSINLTMEKRKNFYLIFKEAVNNAYKYSMCKTVNVVLAAGTGKLVMIITDDGCGFDILQEKTHGNGLKNMHDRAKEIGADIDIKSWEAKGTRLELSLPLK